MNLKIKFRESFRPFAPSVLQEQVHEYFKMPGNGDGDSPYMLLVAPVLPDKREPGSREKMRGLTGLDLLRVKRSVIPAVTHVDFSARIQTVDEPRHGRYYRLLKKFYEKTGCPAIVNTSFNIRSEPIVCTPADGYRCFMGTNIDALVMENVLLLKSEQPAVSSSEVEAYRSQFLPD